MKGIVFDLELNQPSQDIIEIGAYLVNYKSYVFLEEFQTFCRLSEGQSLNPEVAKLCQITEEQVNAGVERAEGIRAFWRFLVESKCQGNLACWGRDLDIIIEQSRALGVVVPSGICGYNVLAASKRFGIRAGKNSRRGLKSALDSVGIKFEDQRHRACPDSKNLAYYEFHILKCQERYRRTEEFVQEFFQEKVLPNKKGYQDFFPPEKLENRAVSLLQNPSETPKIEIPEKFTYKDVNYKTVGPAKMEDSLGNWLEGIHYSNDKGEIFFRTTHSFQNMCELKEDLFAAEDDL